MKLVGHRSNILEPDHLQETLRIEGAGGEENTEGNERTRGEVYTTGAKGKWEVGVNWS
jgi:hypothetical protein